MLTSDSRGQDSGTATIYFTLTIVNMTHMDSITSVTTEEESVSGSQLWHQILRYSNTTVTVIGLIANTVAWIILLKSKQGFSKVILFLLQHQSFLDALVCLMGLILVATPSMWTTGITTLDVFICYLWHSQILYWWGYLVSLANLLLVATERYIAVCHPFKHQNLSVLKFKIAVVGSNIFVCVLSASLGLQISYKNNDCIAKPSITGPIAERYFSAYAILVWIVCYATPCSILCTLYYRIIQVLRKRSSGLGHSRVISKATADITKTAAVVTIIVFIAISYDVNLFVLGYFGLADYVMGTPQQQVGVLLANINSSANPFVYLILMPAYKRNVMSAFDCCRKDAAENSTHENTQPNTAPSSDIQAFTISAASESISISVD